MYNIILRLNQLDVMLLIENLLADKRVVYSDIYKINYTVLGIRIRSSFVIVLLKRNAFKFYRSYFVPSVFSHFVMFEMVTLLESNVLYRCNKTRFLYYYKGTICLFITITC